MNKNIYLGLLGVWLMSPPKQQSDQPPEVTSKLSPAKEARSKSSSEQGESSDDSDSDSEVTSLSESKSKILKLKSLLKENKRERRLLVHTILEIRNNNSLLDIIQRQDKEIEQLEKEVRAMSNQHIEQLQATSRRLEKQSEIAGKRADAAIASMIRQGKK